MNTQEIEQIRLAEQARCLALVEYAIENGVDEKRLGRALRDGVDVTEWRRQLSASNGTKHWPAPPVNRPMEGGALQAFGRRYAGP